MRSASAEASATKTVGVRRRSGGSLFDRSSAIFRSLLRIASIRWIALAGFGAVPRGIARGRGDELDEPRQEPGAVNQGEDERREEDLSTSKAERHGSLLSWPSCSGCAPLPVIPRCAMRRAISWPTEVRSPSRPRLRL